MKNFDDKQDGQISRHFRDALEQYNVPYQEEHWQQMRAKLVGNMPFYKRWYYTLEMTSFLHVGLATVAGLIAFVVFLQPALQEQNAEERIAPREPSTLADPHFAQLEQPVPESDIVEVIPSEPLLPIASVETNQNLPKTAAASQPVVVQKRPALSSGKKLAQVRQSVAQEQVAGIISQPGEQAPLLVSETTVSERSVGGFTEAKLYRNLEKWVSVPALSPSLIQITAAPLASVSPVFVEEKLEQGQAQHRLPMVRIGWVASTLLNSSKPYNVTEFGRSFNLEAGLTGEVKLFRGLYLNAGFLFNNHRQDYFNSEEEIIRSPQFIVSASPDQLMEAMQHPRHVIADISMLNFPISLRYYIPNTRHSGNFFVAAGFNNHTFIREQYSYRYLSGNVLPESFRGMITNLPDSRVLTGESSMYWASQISISAGYEWHLHERWSLMAEPFVRLPVREMGYHQIRFATYGFSIRTNLLSY